MAASSAWSVRRFPAWSWQWQATPGEHTLAHGLPMEMASPDHRWEPKTAPEVRAPDGDGLGDALRRVL